MAFINSLYSLTQSQLARFAQMKGWIQSAFLSRYEICCQDCVRESRIATRLIANIFFLPSHSRFTHKRKLEKRFELTVAAEEVVWGQCPQGCATSAHVR